MSSNVSSRDKHSLSYMIRSGIAGGVAGCVAKTTVAPLDRVKILFQASNPDFQKYAGTWSGAFHAGREIYRAGGIRGLLQGHSATLLRIFPYAGIKFMAYDQVHHLLMPTPQDETSTRKFTAGAISGMVSVFFTYPLELLRVRMAFQTRTATSPLFPSVSPTTCAGAFRQIYHETATTPSPTSASTLFARFPLLKFYRGFTVTIAGMIPYAGMSFLTWDVMRARLRPRVSGGGDGSSPPAASPARPSPLADFAAGAVAGAVGQTVSYPFEVVRRRMQVGGITSPGRWLRWNETALAVWHNGGWRGFYVGLSIGYLKVIPMTAVSFMVWQGCKRVLGV